MGWPPSFKPNLSLKASYPTCNPKAGIPTPGTAPATERAPPIKSPLPNRDAASANEIPVPTPGTALNPACAILVPILPAPFIAPDPFVKTSFATFGSKVSSLLNVRPLFVRSLTWLVGNYADKTLHVKGPASTDPLKGPDVAYVFAVARSGVAKNFLPPKGFVLVVPE